MRHAACDDEGMPIVLKTLGIVALATIGIWLVARLLGFHLALVPSLLISLGLTLLLNIGPIFRSFRRRDRY